MRLIDADALKKNKVYSRPRREYVVPVAYIDWAETVDQVKHAHWIVKKNNNGSIINFWCSSCGPDVNYVMDKYCPHCGAKMDSEVEYV